MRGASGLRIALGFGISAILVAVLVQAADPQKLASSLASAELWPMIPALGLYFVGLWLRSLRWGLLLPPGSVPRSSLFRALAIGFTVNNVLPVRLGELARAYLLARWCGVPYGTTVASVVVERVLDGLTLGGLLLLGLLFVPAPSYLSAIGLLVAGGFAAGAVMLAAAAWHSHLIESVAGLLAAPLPERLRSIVLRLATSFAHALSLIRGWRLLAQLVVLSLAAWLFELALFWTMMQALPMPRSISSALVAGAVANFATLIPSSPGYVGTFDGALVRVLMDISTLPTELATAYALLVHLVLFLPVTVLGTVLLWRDQLSLGQLSHVAPPPPVAIGEPTAAEAT